MILYPAVSFDWDQPIDALVLSRVRFWHLADMHVASKNVHFRG
jgi:hypothetical protein